MPTSIPTGSGSVADPAYRSAVVEPVVELPGFQELVDSLEEEAGEASKEEG